MKQSSNSKVLLEVKLELLIVLMHTNKKEGAKLAIFSRANSYQATYKHVLGVVGFLLTLDKTVWQTMKLVISVARKATINPCAEKQKLHM